MTEAMDGAPRSSRFAGLDSSTNDDDDRLERPPRPETSTTFFAVAALDAALTRKAHERLQKPGVFIVVVPSANWTSTIAEAFRWMNPVPTVVEITERQRNRGILERTGARHLERIQKGFSVIYITPDPEELLDESVLASADLTITVPPASPALLRRVIRRLTGQQARGVTEEMAALDLTVHLTVLRAGLSARECVANLRRAVERQPVPEPKKVPALADLPLSPPVRNWTDQVLADLNAVTAGALAPDALVYAMLEGPPGTGKTLLAESLAAAAGWTFVPSSIGAWFTVGDGALGGVARNLSLFIDRVLAAEPAIAFMDELDALPDRAALDGRGRDWWTPVITLFLTEIDRLRKSGRQVLIIGATNYFDRLDDALVRPGRLQQRVPVLPAATDDEVIALLRYWLKGELTDAELGSVARLGRGATPAAVEGWVKAARSAARAEHRPLQLSDLVGQMVLPDTRSEADIRAIAVHEIGHATVAHHLGHTVESVSIVPAGASGGRTSTSLPSLVPTQALLVDQVTISLGGRAADTVLGSGPNAGAESDLARATELLLAARECQGLYGTLISHRVTGTRSRSPRTMREVDAELARLLARAIAIVSDQRDAALVLVDRLIADRVLDGDAVAAVLAPPDLTTAHPPEPSQDMADPPPDVEPDPEMARSGDSKAGEVAP